MNRYQILIIISGLCLASVSHNVLPVLSAENKAGILQQENTDTPKSYPAGDITIALQDRKDTANKQPAAPSGKKAELNPKNTTSSTGKNKKRVPLGKFEPSEKIRVDKAVDFPADI